MAYTKTVWLETSMSTVQKLSALDNLEGMYGQAVSYIDAITHSSSYYTDAQAAARYFPKGVKTNGSIAATLDGYTAEEIIAGGTPSGNICWWSGSEASIPAGFVLCNGLNGTPDLRNRFVPGAGSHYTKAETGGANTVTTAGTVTIAGHGLTATQVAKHTHGTVTDNYASGLSSLGGAGAAMSLTIGNTTSSKNTGYTGSGDAHGHTGSSWAGTSNQEKRPPFYALCLIQKS
ncbi:hypothetical protein M0R72_20690 [Candidatus Pacearchaeota archaeon]|jgi:hypothetical protein|nr:hypothetical protein [Candidatus Pacearchaeota archaeon]